MATRLLSAIALTIGLFAASVEAQTWDGGGAAGGAVTWTTGANWNPDGVPVNNGTANLILAGTIDTTNTVDINFDILGLTFNNTAGAFVINNSGGSTLTIRGGGITNNDAQTETLNLPVALAANQTWNAAAGDLSYSTVNLNNNQLMLDGANDHSLLTTISGASGSIVKNGAGTVTFSGLGSTFGGGVTLNAGTIQVNNAGALGSGTVTINGGAVEALGSPRTVGNAITVGGNFSTVGSQDLTFTGAAALTGEHIITTNNAGTTTFSGAIGPASAGSKILEKAGTGTLVLSGSAANTHSLTRVLAGTLVLAKTPGVAAPGFFLTVGDTSGGVNADIARLGANDQILDNTGVIVRTSGLFDLNGFSDSMQDLDLYGGNVTTGAGTLTITNEVFHLGSSDATSTITGNLSLGGNNVQFDIENGAPAIDVNVSAVISNGGITKSGAGTLTMTGNMTYSGATTISAGTLSLGNGGTSGSIVGDITNNAALEFNRSDATSYGGVISGTGNLTKLGIGTLTITGGSANTYSGNTTVNAGTLVLNKTAGVNAIASTTISVGDFAGADILRLAADNQISDGTVVIVRGAGQFDLNGFSDTFTTLLLEGGSVTTGAGTLTFSNALESSGNATSTVAGNLSLGGQNRFFLINDGSQLFDVDISAAIANGGITKTGTGTLLFSGASANTYTGTTTVNEGSLVLNKSGLTGAFPGSLGNLVIGDGIGGAGADIVLHQAPNQIANSSTVTINSSGLLDIISGGAVGGLSMTSGQVNIAGGGASLFLLGDLATNAHTDAATISGAGILNFVGLTRTFTVADGAAPVDLDVSAVVGGGALIKSGDGTLQFSGSLANAYSEGTTINAGTLVFNKLPGFAAANGNVIIGDGTGGANADVLRLMANEQIDQTSIQSVTVNSSGLFDLNGQSESIGNLVLNGGHVGAGILIPVGDIAVNANAQTALIESTINLGGLNTDVTVADGVAAVDLNITGAITNGSLNKTGAGTMQLTDTADNLVFIDVSAGTLLLANTGGSAVDGTLQVGDDAGGVNVDVVRYQANNQINDAATLSIQSSGLLDFNGFSDTLGGFTMTGGSITTGAGTLALAGDIGTVPSGLTASIAGNINLGAAPRTFTVNEGAATIDLDVSGTLTAGMGGQLVKAGTGTLQLSGTQNVPIVLNAGTLTATFTIGPTGSLTQNAGTTVTGTLTNQGTFTYNGGTFAGQLVNEGVVNFGANFTAGNGIVNLGVFNLLVGHSLTSNGAGLDNLGTITLESGTIGGNGPLVNNSVLSGRGTIAGSAGFSNNGSVSVEGGNLSLTNSGANANAGLITVPFGLQLRLLGGNLTNTGIIDLEGGSISGTGTLVNAAGGTVQGGSSVQSAMSNDGGLIHANAGTTLLITNLVGGNTNGGELRIENGSGINVTSAFSSSGTIVLLGANAQLIGGAVNNTGTLRGSGRVSNSVQNSGTVLAEGGRLTLSTGGHTNTAAGVVEAHAAAEVFYSQGLAVNAGQIALVGGTFDNNNRTLDNNGSIAGDGVLRTGGLTNDGSIGVGGGDLDLVGPVTNNTTITIQSVSTARFFGPVNGPGNYPGAGTAMFLNSFSPGASPAQVNFGGNLVFGGAASLIIELAGTAAGAEFDRLVVAGTASLAGGLNVVLLDDFAPSAGNGFEIVAAAAGISGTFASESLPALGANLQWDVVYGANNVVLQVLSTGLPGDYNSDDIVDAADYTVWRNNLGDATEADILFRGDGAGGVDEADYNVWRSHYGETSFGGPGSGGFAPTDGSVSVVPEPASAWLALLGALFLAQLSRRAGTTPGVPR